MITNIADTLIEGSVVHLVSGGPSMTVSSKKTYGANTVFTCKWFDVLGKIHEQEFRQHEIEECEPNQLIWGP